MDLAELRSLQKFSEAVRIETDGPPRPFADVADAWQKKAIGEISSAMESLVRDEISSAVRRAWWVRPRGHAKTADASMLILYVLAFSKRRRRAVWVAADKDQGVEGLDAISTLCRHNKWLNELLTIKADRVENKHTGSILYFTTSDVSSAFGWKDIDTFIMDEITHWGAKGEALWTAIYSAAGKRSNSVVLALMNAGFGDTWQANLRNVALGDPNWAFSELPGPVATWVPSSQLADQKKFLPKIAFERLWLNRWTTGSGDALDADEIDRAITLAGPLTKAEKGWQYVAGLDLGLRRDASALIVLGVHVGHLEEIARKRPTTRATRAMVEAGLVDAPTDEIESIFHEGTGQIKLACVDVWEPGREKVSIDAIEKRIIEVDSKFRLAGLAVDPWQAAQLIERLQKQGVNTTGLDFVPNNLKAMATAVLGVFQDSRIELYRHAQLIADLRALRVVEKSYGVRLMPSQTSQGTRHGDAATALALALLLAKKMEFGAIQNLNQPLIVA